jgi:large subunit ribosomal protein L3
MVNGLWGKKIGMTQVFSQKQKVIPVTVIDISNWYITQVKTKENDGYDAVQVGCVKDRYVGQHFSDQWLKDPKKYFSSFKEIRAEQPEHTVSEITIGQPIDITILSQGDNVDVFGITKGAGFQGVVKRHGFAGGRASHGATFGRFTGSLSHMRSRGRVIKGKRMPGHMGTEQRVMRNLEVIRVESDARVVLVKGSVPGKSGSLVFVRKRR